MRRQNHYEVAFESFMRERRLPYVAVDESKSPLMAGSKLKSFDFLAYSRTGPNLLVDVKGRRATNGVSLQTWATRKDVDDLWQWERVFGEGFCAVLAFVYEVPPPRADQPGLFRPPATVTTGERCYLLLAVTVAAFRDGMVRRSEKWDTVTLPARLFRKAARPFDELL